MLTPVCTTGLAANKTYCLACYTYVYLYPISVCVRLCVREHFVLLYLHSFCFLVFEICRQTHKRNIALGSNMKRATVAQTPFSIVCGLCECARACCRQPDFIHKPQNLMRIIIFCLLFLFGNIFDFFLVYFFVFFQLQEYWLVGPM